MHPIFRTAVCACLTFATALSHSNGREAVFGRWASDGSIIEITEREGALSARVLSIRQAVYGAGEARAQGTTRRDDNNPEPALRERLIVGIDLLSGYTFDDGKWRGQIYDPESGKTFTSHMKAGAKGRLEMRGYIGVPMLGRTVLFDPIEGCKPHIVEMLSRIPELTMC